MQLNSIGESLRVMSQKTSQHMGAVFFACLAILSRPLSLEPTETTRHAN